MRLHSHAWILGIALGAMCAMFTPAHTAAASTQVQAAPDSYVVAKRDGVRMRCRAGSIWYVVSELKAGQVLRVTGERDGWLAVEYPPGTPAVTRIERVELRENTKGEEVAVLTRKSSLYAYNADEPTRDTSYAAVFGGKDELEAGTALPILGTIDRRGGTLGGYLVSPPRGAVGYIQPLAADVRSATESEVKLFLETSGWGTEATDDDPDVGTPAQPTGAGDEQTTDDEAEGDGASSDEATVTDDGTADGSASESTGDAEEPVTDPYERAERELGSLDEAFQRVLRTPMEQAELSGLIDSYEALRTSVPADEIGDAFRDAIDVRLALLDIRAELQRVAMDASALEARVQDTPDAQAVERSNSLGYEAVGRLMPSLIYNGERLPLLYRVVSVDTAYGRTIAYVAPREDMNLASALGAIVGVHGIATTEQDRRVPILTPERVDVLRTSE